MDHKHSCRRCSCRSCLVVAVVSVRTVNCSVVAAFDTAVVAPVAAAVVDVVDSFVVGNCC